MGHDGFVRGEKIMNDITVMQLQKQAVMQARAGSDVVAPVCEISHFDFSLCLRYVNITNSNNFFYVIFLFD